MDNATLLTLFVIFLAYLFDFINGFHDAANSIATIVTTKVLKPKQAVMYAAFFNFIAFFFFHLSVAQTIGEGLITPQLINSYFILAALMGAITWNLATWYFGIPSSSSHALIGGLAGAALAKGGLGSLKLSGFSKVLLGIFISPLVGLLVALILAFVFTKLSHHAHKSKFHSAFKGLQLLSSALLSISHGGNDAQKTMGIIAIVLFSASWLEGPFFVPYWVVISCQLLISLGTLVGGWRIVHTLGTQITSLNPLNGAAAETGTALSIGLATFWGIPVSTTHTITGAITGVGLLKGLYGPKWYKLFHIFYSWLLTIPASGLIAAFFIWLHPS